MHFAELCFFEIGRNPDVIDLRDREHLFAGLHALAQFHGFFVDDAVHGSNDCCI